MAKKKSEAIKIYNELVDVMKKAGFALDPFVCRAFKSACILSYNEGRLKGMDDAGKILKPKKPVWPR